MCNKFGYFSIPISIKRYIFKRLQVLADVFETFKATCLRGFDLDPTHYYTSPGRQNDIFLIYTIVHAKDMTVSVDI